MAAPPRILLSNDDGFAAEGLLTLISAVEGLGEVWVVAPEREQSATSHSLSLHHPLRIRALERAPRHFAVDGTPADCVYLAVNHLMLDRPPALVLSGINQGPNLADDVIYSGTVAAAMEGAVLGVPSIAFSLASKKRPHRFDHCVGFVRAFVTETLGHVVAQRVPSKLLLNVNLPPDSVGAGYQITRLGRHTYGANVIEKEDPRGRKYYWIGGTGYEHVTEPGTDVTAVLDEKRVSVTPLMLDFTDHAFVEPLRDWSVPGFTQAPAPQGSR